MQQPVYLNEISSAARQAKQYRMNKQKFIHLRNWNICGLAASANYNLVHDFGNKNESTDDDVSCEMRFIVNENNRGGTSEPLEEDKKFTSNICHQKNQSLQLIL